MVEYTAEFALKFFDSGFVDDTILLEKLGGSKHDINTVRRYLNLPIAARPDLSWFFDRQFYLETYPDIVRAEVDPLIHFMNWGIVEGRNPHPFIDLQYIRSIDQTLLTSPASVSALADILASDLVDPSPYFSIDFYKSQLRGEAPEGGSLCHYLQQGALRELKPNPGMDPIAYHRPRSLKDPDIRSCLRDFVLERGRLNLDENLVAKKLFLESMMYRDSNNLEVRGRYFDYLLKLSNNLFGAIFATLPEIPAPILIRAASSDILNFRNIFSYVSGKITEYAYGIYGFDMPRPRRILDIGAYCGYSAVYFANRFPDAQIVCIEPPGANFDALTVNIAAYPNIRALPAAIWPHRSTVRSAGHVSGDWGNFYAEVTEIASESAIPAYTIDDVLEMVGWNNVDFVKCQAENVTVDVLCSGERRWLEEVSCFYAFKSAGRWPRPDDEALLQATFPDTLFDKISEEHDLRVFPRRTTQKSAASYQREPVQLVPPSPQNRHFVLENVPADPFNFYRFDYSSFQLAPNPPGEPVATLRLRMPLSGHTGFHTKIVTGPTKSAALNFHITMINVGSGAMVLDADCELPGEFAFDWEIGFEPATGLHEIKISTETVRTGDDMLWARFVDPRLV
jgi:FkbM family methyltransferase